jgi:hypothetical protein
LIRSRAFLESCIRAAGKVAIGDHGYRPSQVSEEMITRLGKRMVYSTSHDKRREIRQDDSVFLVGLSAGSVVASPSSLRKVSPDTLPKPGLPSAVFLPFRL